MSGQQVVKMDLDPIVEEQKKEREEVFESKLP